MELNKIYEGDCLELMNDIPDNSVHLVLTDLPYNLGYIEWDKMLPIETLWSQWKRILTDKGTVILTATEPFTSLLVTSQINLFRFDLIWIKDNNLDFLRASVKPIRRHENILVFSKGTAASNCDNNLTYNPQNVVHIHEIHKGIAEDRIKDTYNISRPSTIRPGGVKSRKNYPTTILYGFKKDKELYHPTQKPVSLFAYLIKTFSNENDTVLDCCAGSGTTGLACIETNRNFILIEQDPKYVKISEKRIQYYKNKFVNRLL